MKKKLFVTAISIISVIALTLSAWAVMPANALSVYQSSISIEELRTAWNTADGDKTFAYVNGDPVSKKEFLFEKYLNQTSYQAELEKVGGDENKMNGMVTLLTDEEILIYIAQDRFLLAEADDAEINVL